MKVGLTLPSFRDDPAVPLAVARAAEEAGLDGVFAYDHLFRTARDGTRRPALECTTLLAACAVETRRITLGALVVRATLRPPAVLVSAWRTLRAVAGDRLVLAIGAGDHESRPEMDAFGLPFASEPERVAALGATVLAAREAGLSPVWVGGSARHVGDVAARSDGWNRWGVPATGFVTELAAVRAATPPDTSTVTASWGGLVVLAEDDDAARAKAERLGASAGAIVGGPRTVAARLREYGDAGAEWVIVGPVDSSDPENARLLGERVVPALRALARG